MNMTREKTNLDSVGVGLLLVVALGIFLFFDLINALSVYLQFTLGYAAFWLVVGIVLLRRKPRQYQLSILALFLVAVLTVYFINWDSRKSFLKDFYQVKVGMTAAQVDQMMGDYLKFVSPAAEVNDKGEVVAGTVSYQHTQQGWGDSDIGVLTFESGRVVQITFYPD